jgi:hypothetical protein
MTDWTAETQKGVEKWIEAQQAWWGEVLGASGQPGVGGVEAAAKAIDAWREAAYRIVDAQAELLRATLENDPGSQAQDLLRKWTDAQRALWRDWLATTGGEPPSDTKGSTAEEAGVHMVESLRAAAEHLVRSQADWAKAWTDAQR